MTEMIFVLTHFLLIYVNDLSARQVNISDVIVLN